MSPIFRKKKSITCTFSMHEEKHVAMLSLGPSLYKDGEHIVRVVDYFRRVDQSNIFVGFTNLLIIFSLNLSTH